MLLLNTCKPMEQTMQAQGGCAAKGCFGYPRRVAAGMLALALSAFLLVVLMMAPPALAAEGAETPQAAGGSFMMAAVNTDGTYIVEPVAVPYTAGQTAEQALEATGFQFVFDSGGTLKSIDGVTPENSLFSYMYTNYASHADSMLKSVDASTITALFITADSSIGELSEAHCAVLDELCAYSSRTDGLRNYADAASAYNSARTGLPTASGSSAQTLADNLKSAISAYDALMSGTKYAVSFTVTQNGAAVGNAVITLTDAYGNETIASNGTASVVPGAYTYEADSSDGLFGVCCTSLSVAASAQSVAVDLPSENWFGSVDLMVKADGRSCCPILSGSAAARKLAYAVPDIVNPMADLYVYANAASSISSSVSSYPFHVVYTGTNGMKYDQVIGYAGLSYAPEYMVACGLGTNAVTYEIRHYTDAAKKTYQVERCEASLMRSPTLSGLSVKDGALECLPAFFGYTTGYSVVTASDSLVFTPSAYGSAGQGYSVTVNGVAVAEGADATVQVPSSAMTTPAKVPIVVSLPNGTSKTYTVSITKAAQQSVTLTHDAGVDVAVYNASGSQVAASATASSAATYSLLDGQEYTYVATKDTWYHTRNTFAASSGATISVPTPKTEDWLSSIVLSADGYYKNSLYADASATLHEHSWTVPDSHFTTFLKATMASGIAGVDNSSLVYTVSYASQDTGAAKVATLAKSTDSSTGESLAKGSIDKLLRMGGYGNTATLTVTSTATGSAGETYYQDYSLGMTRKLTARAIAVSDANGSLVMTQTATIGTATPTTKFEGLVTDYTIGVPAGTASVNISFIFAQPSAATDIVAGGYTADIGGTAVAYDLADTAKVYTAAVALDTAKSTQDILVKVDHAAGKSPETVYTITVNSLPKVGVSFTKSPEAANITLTEDISGNRIMPGSDGTYQLIQGYSYSWTAACSGYVGASGQFEASDGKVVDVALAKAADNPGIDPAIPAGWPLFRKDSYNNAVISDPTPISGSQAVLYWASPLGEGYSANAAGCPILVDGYLYSYAANKIYKVDTVTGKTVATGTMAGASSFAITPMTYAQGMVFIALSNGQVEAFNADTLDSLWVYTSPHGGQPNCPITYWDGKIYTGFWNWGTKTDFVCLTITDEDPSKTNEAKQPLWSYAHGGGFYWAGAYASDSYVIEGSNDPSIAEGLTMTGENTVNGPLYSFDASTGAVLDTLAEYPGGVKVGNIRSTVVFDKGSGRCYYTTRAGYLCSVIVNADGTFDHSSVQAIRLKNTTTGTADESISSTSTPVIYNGRAYVGADTGSYNAYAGQCVDVVDLSTGTVAYTVQMGGRAQASALLTTAYEAEDGYVYVYFFDNYTPGKLRYFKDKAGQTKAITNTVETSTDSGVTTSYNVADVLFCPMRSQAQYCICSPVVDEYGTIYFKNDSAYMMAVGSTIEKVEVTKQPTKTIYALGDTFDPAGIQVTATYSNGKTRDITGYVEYSATTLATEGTATVKVTFPYTMYQSYNAGTDIGSAPGYNYDCPSTSLDVSVQSSLVPTITTTSLPEGQEGIAYVGKLEAYGAPSTFTWTLAGQLPSGLVFDASTGAISGTPAAGSGGEYKLAVTAANSVGTSAEKSITLVIDQKPSITTDNTLPVALVGTGYSTTLAGTGYPKPLSWQVIDNASYALPSGLALDASTGVVSGTPTASGTYKVLIRASVQTSAGTTLSSNYRQFSLTVNELPSITTESLPDAALDADYTTTLQSAGYPAPAWSIVSGRLPNGLALDAKTGAISGKPTESGTFAIMVQAANDVGTAANPDKRTATKELSLIVGAAPVITTTALPDAAEGEAYSAPIEAAGSPAPTISVEGLPGGLAYDAVSGCIAGTPQAGTAGSYQVTITASTGVAVSVKKTLALVVGGKPAITTSSLPGAAVGAAYSATLAASGYPAPTWSISGTLPAGLVFDAKTATISGTPTKAGDSTVQVSATNSAGSSTVSLVISVGIKPAISTASLDAATVGLPYSAVIEASGTPAPTFSVSGTLPPGLALDAATGAISGSPRVAGTYTFTVIADNGHGTAASKSFSLAINPWKRLWGDTAFDTMAAIVDEGSFSTGGTVIIATRGGYLDALTASGLAGMKGAPVLLATTDALPDQARAELYKLKPSEVVICGGTAAISDACASQIAKAAGVTPVRYWGATATGTARSIYESQAGWSKTCFVATRNSFADALSIAPYAYANKCPIFLTDSSTLLEDETLADIRSGGFTDVYIVGGANAVSRDVEGALGGLFKGRLAGDTRYETSEKIAEWEVARGMAVNKLALATGSNYPDALCGAALCGRCGSVLLLVSDDNRYCIDTFAGNNKGSIATFYVFGGPSAVSEETRQHMDAVLGK